MTQWYDSVPIFVFRFSRFALLSCTQLTCTCSLLFDEETSCYRSALLPSFDASAAALDALCPQTSSCLNASLCNPAVTGAQGCACVQVEKEVVKAIRQMEEVEVEVKKKKEVSSRIKQLRRQVSKTLAAM